MYIYTNFLWSNGIPGLIVFVKEPDVIAAPGSDKVLEHKTIQGHKVDLFVFGQICNDIEMTDIRHLHTKTDQTRHCNLTLATAMIYVAVAVDICRELANKTLRIILQRYSILAFATDPIPIHIDA